MADYSDTRQLNDLTARSEKFVADLKATLHRDLRDQGDVTSSWLRDIKHVEDKRKPPRVVNGVVGATGSGKSSIINAVLGEKQLVPTSCMRACTAVVTEISYNNGSTAYRAVIEFISPQEWRNELELLINDIVSNGRVTNDYDDDNTQAGIAFAKIQAVYPHLNRENLSAAVVDELLDSDDIKAVVGTKIEFNAPTAKEIHSNIQKYVDSGDKMAKDFADHGPQATSTLAEIAYWPLIRVVHIYTKSSVLESGSVLVDLPGVADSNEARAAIAQRYLQNCASLCIVAPIIRAVDDKSARHLLNESFKRQLWRDGTLQRLTFICSKTDEISITEAREALQRYPEFRDKFATIDRDRTTAMNQQDALQQSLLEVKQRIGTTLKLHKEAMQEETEYKDLRSRGKDGHAIYPLVRVEVFKRRAAEEESDTPSSPIKKVKHQFYSTASPESLNQSSVPSLSGLSSIQIQFREDSSKPRLALLDVKNTLDGLKEKKRELKADIKVSKQTEQELKQNLTANKGQIADIDSREWVTCVRGRNKVSTHAIRTDFAAGLRDMIKDERGEMDEANDDGIEEEEEEERETQCVDSQNSMTLPVFCVSAKRYYKLSGDLESEKTAGRSAPLDETGIPALRKHVCKLGNDEMTAALQAYVAQSKRLRTSLRLWSAGGMAESSANSAMREDEDFCLRLVSDLVSSVYRMANGVMDANARRINSQVLAALPLASSAASDAAVLTAMQWVASRKAETPGLYYQTFKAVVRRSGALVLPKQTHNFNADLLQPFVRQMDTRWNQVFNERIEKDFQKALKDGSSALDKFVEPFSDRLSHGQDSASSTVRQMFDEQMNVFTNSLGMVLKAARKSIDNHQREANRLFEESVKTQMKTIYTTLEGVNGTGSYNRCKEKIQVYLDENKDVIFDKVSQRVRTKLQAMLEEVRGTLLTDLESICDSFQRDCRYLCQKSRDFSALPESGQKAITRVLEEADAADAEVQLATGDQDVNTSDSLASQYDKAGFPAHGGTQPLSLQSMTPVLMAANNKEDWSISEAQSESDLDDDSSDDEEV